MILDTGICSIFRPEDHAVGGAMPKLRYSLLYKSWYGELSF